MAWSPSDSLVIGVSSRALFSLDEEDRIYRTLGTQAFIDYQRQHEDLIIQPGVAFPLVEALLKLNDKLRTVGPTIEVVIISKNHPDCGVRIKRSILHHGLPIRRSVFTGGQDTLPFLRAVEVDLFLANEEQAVATAIANKISAGLIYGGPATAAVLDGTPVIAFDGDAVLFSADADNVYKKHKLPGFEAFEFDNLTTVLPPGPLHRFALALEELRAGHPIDNPPFRIALVTARALTYSERPLRTLREQGIRVDISCFLDGMSKGTLLAELKPLIFFDDSPTNCADACITTPTARIPLEEPAIVAAVPRVPRSPERFYGICKLFLKKDFSRHESALRVWYDDSLSDLSDDALGRFTDEFDRSVRGTPAGYQRRAAGRTNDKFTKLLQFAELLKRKHASQQ